MDRGNETGREMEQEVIKLTIEKAPELMRSPAIKIRF